MSKRGAGFQLTRFEHEAERPEVPIVEVSKASNDVMAKRQIAPRPKARGTNEPSAATPIANPFASFSQTAKPSAPVPSASSTPSETSRARLVGLNNRFAKTIEEYSKTNVAGSWVAACEKYLSYVKSIEHDSTASPSPSLADPMGQNAGSSTGPASMSSSAADSGTPAFKPPTKFTFGKPASESSSGAPVKFEAPKSFTFGQSSTPAAVPEISKQEPAKFSFSKPLGSVEQEKREEPSAPKFSFGDQPKINFTGSSEAPKFTFGANNAPNSEAKEPPKFSFGANSGSASDTPKFTFGKKESFGDETKDAAPKFSFGNSGSNSSSNGDSAPAKFSFGNSSNTAPKFTFGNSGASGSASKFSFGQPSAGTANVNQTWKPSEKPAESSADADEDDDDQPTEEQQDFTGKGAGEECEDSVFEVRTKLYDSSNESAGLGVLRILVHRDTKKSRVVVRADGSGRVLINTILPQAVTYTATKQFVSIPTFGGEKPVTYRARVKTEESAKELADKLNEFKA